MPRSTKFMLAGAFVCSPIYAFVNTTRGVPDWVDVCLILGMLLVGTGIYYWIHDGK